MKTVKLAFIFIILTNTLVYSQIKKSNNVFVSDGWSSNDALFDAKKYLLNNVLEANSEVVQFEIISLAAATSEELTTLLYKCESKQKEGLVLGFYGNYSTDAGIQYQGYGFKNIEKNQVVEFLHKIKSAIDDNSKFLFKNSDEFNIYFKYDDTLNFLKASKYGRFGMKQTKMVFRCCGHYTGVDRHTKP